MSSLKDLIFRKLLKLPLLAFKLTGFDFLQQASNETVKPSRMGKLANQAKKLFFWINFFSCALLYFSGAVYSIHHLDDFDTFVANLVNLINDTAILAKVFLINHHRTRILEMFQNLNDSSYDKACSEVQERVASGVKTYKMFERINLTLLVVGSVSVNLIPFVTYLLAEKSSLTQLLWLPFDPFAANVVFIMNLWIFWTFIVFGLFFFASDMIILSVIVMITTLFKVLTEDVRTFNSTPKEFYRLVKSSSF